MNQMLDVIEILPVVQEARCRLENESCCRSLSSLSRAPYLLLFALLLQIVTCQVPHHEPHIGDVSLCTLDGFLGICTKDMPTTCGQMGETIAPKVGGLA